MQSSEKKKHARRYNDLWDKFEALRKQNLGTLLSVLAGTATTKSDMTPNHSVYHARTPREALWHIFTPHISAYDYEVYRSFFI